jgi:hypothetical protein
MSLGWMRGMHSHERIVVLQVRGIDRSEGKATSRDEETLLNDPFGRPRS